MKKLIVKTICLSLAFLLGSIFCAFGLATISVPGRVGFIFDGVGAYSASVFFYEKQFRKSEDINDLYILVTKIDLEEDSQRAEYWLEEIISHQQFNELCKEIDKKGSSISTSDYCYSSYCFALIENGKIDIAKNALKLIKNNSLKKAVDYEIEQKTNTK